MAANPVVPTPQLQFITEEKSEETIVHGTGKITVATAALLESTMRGLIHRAKRIVLDLTAVKYIDSVGLLALVGIYMAAKRAHCDLEIANPHLPASLLPSEPPPSEP
jgi:anti-anti-sigma factor